MTDSPSVVQVSPYYPPHLGGVEVVVARLSQAQVELGHDVQVITTTCGAAGAPRRERHGGVLVRRARGFELAHTPVAPGLLPALLRAPRGAVVHLHVAHAGLPELVRWTCALRGRSYVVHFHLDVDPSGPMGRLLPAYKRRVLGPVLRAAAAVLVLSRQQASFVEGQHGVQARRVHVVPNGVGAEYLEVGRRRGLIQAGQDRSARTGPPEDRSARDREPLRLLYVGRLSKQKNLPRLMQAMARLPRGLVELTVVGDGEDRGLVQDAVTNGDLSSVRLIGARQGPALLDTLAGADAFVLPSDKEGMPLAVLEAMAAGLPVIATDVPGTRELVGDAGVLVPPDAGHLAQAIADLAGDPERRLRLSRAGRSVAGRSWTSVAEDVREVYRSAAR